MLSSTDTTRVYVWPAKMRLEDNNDQVEHRICALCHITLEDENNFVGTDPIYTEISQDMLGNLMTIMIIGLFFFFVFFLGGWGWKNANLSRKFGW